MLFIFMVSRPPVFFAIIEPSCRRSACLALYIFDLQTLLFEEAQEALAAYCPKRSDGQTNPDRTAQFLDKDAFALKIWKLPASRFVVCVRDVISCHRAFTGELALPRHVLTFRVDHSGAGQLAISFWACKGKSPPAPTGGLSKTRRRPTLPHPLKCSTIGAVGLNFRVRNGNGCDPYAMTAEKLYTVMIIATVGKGQRIVNVKLLISLRLLLTHREPKIDKFAGQRTDT